MMRSTSAPTRLRTEPYPVVGSSIEQLRASIAALGPIRGGRRFGAFTDWEVAWRFEHEACSEGRRISAVVVEVRASMSLPRWLAPSNAAGELVAAWARYAAAIEEHERGHVAIAERAGATIQTSLLALPPLPSLGLLRAAGRQAVDAALAQARTEELAYDHETNHGEAQGVILSSQGEGSPITLVPQQPLCSARYQGAT